MARGSVFCGKCGTYTRPVVDARTPEELMDIIEAKGKEVADALAALRNVTIAVGETTDA